MSIVKVIELVGSSTESSAAAVRNALAEARRTLRNIKAVDVVSVGLRGEELDEWRAHVRVALLTESVGESGGAGSGGVALRGPFARLGRLDLAVLGRRRGHER